MTNISKSSSFKIEDLINLKSDLIKFKYPSLIIYDNKAIRIIRHNLIINWDQIICDRRYALVIDAYNPNHPQGHPLYNPRNIYNARYDDDGQLQTYSQDGIWNEFIYIIYHELLTFIKTKQQEIKDEAAKEHSDFIKAWKEYADRHLLKAVDDVFNP